MLNRFNLIVNPKYYDLAAEIYDRHKNEIHTVALVNTGALNLDISAIVHHHQHPIVY